MTIRSARQLRDRNAAKGDRHDAVLIALLNFAKVLVFISKPHSAGSQKHVASISFLTFGSQPDARD
jgi:hypothetical protein